MVYQNDDGMPDTAQHYACAFMCILRARESLHGIPVTVASAGDAWNGAIKAGVISGDINGDGVMGDDPRELCIQDYGRLFDFLHINLMEVPIESPGLPCDKDDNGILRILPTHEPIDTRAYWVMERWKWKISHFILGDGTGTHIIYDPIRGGSLTRANGTVQDLRVFRIYEGGKYE